MRILIAFLTFACMRYQVPTCVWHAMMAPRVFVELRNAERQNVERQNAERQNV
jgi:hypothetical protein